MKIKKGDEVVLVAQEDYPYAFNSKHGVLMTQGCIGICADIKEHKPAPFDWADVKPGMAFMKKHSHPSEYYLLRWYVAHPVKDIKDASVGCVIVQDREGSVDVFHTDNLDRCPEHDIEVQK